MGTLRVVLICLAAAVLAAPPASCQLRSTVYGGREDVKLPSGKSQKDEILKADHKKSLSELAKLIELAGELQAEMEKNDYIVLSVSSLKKAEEIEKLAKQIRKRLKR